MITFWNFAFLFTVEIYLCKDNRRYWKRRKNHPKGIIKKISSWLDIKKIIGRIYFFKSDKSFISVFEKFCWIDYKYYSRTIENDKSILLFNYLVVNKMYVYIVSSMILLFLFYFFFFVQSNSLTDDIIIFQRST